MNTNSLARLYFVIVINVLKYYHNYIFDSTAIEYTKKAIKFYFCVHIRPSKEICT